MKKQYIRIFSISLPTYVDCCESIYIYSLLHKYCTKTNTTSAIQFLASLSSFSSPSGYCKRSDYRSFSKFVKSNGGRFFLVDTLALIIIFIFSLLFQFLVIVLICIFVFQENKKK